MRADSFLGQLVTALARQTPTFRASPSSGRLTEEIISALGRRGPAFRPDDGPDASRQPHALGGVDRQPSKDHHESDTPGFERTQSGLTRSTGPELDAHLGETDSNEPGGADPARDEPAQPEEPVRRFLELPRWRVSYEAVENESVVGQEQAPPSGVVELPSGEPEQGELFPDPLLGEGPVGLPDQLVGFRGPTACQIVGITFRQLDYWARIGLVVPSIRGAAGSGSQRLYSFKDMLVLKIVKRLLDAGVSLEKIRTAVEHLRHRPAGESLGRGP